GILVETRRDVPRIPLGAIRWSDGRAFAAVTVATASGPAWKWRPVALGVSDTRYAELLSGVEPGERVIAHPELLAAPKARSTRPGGRAAGPVLARSGDTRKHHAAPDH